MNNTNNTELVDLCEKYLSDIKFAAEIQAATGMSLYCNANAYRSATHEKICKLLSKEHFDNDVLEITNNLDKYIGFDVEKDYSDEEIREFAIKLENVLRGV